MSRSHLVLPVLLVSSLGAWGCARTADPGDPGSPDNDPSDRDDTTGDGEGSTTVDEWLGTGGCAFEAEPTPFTGGLAWLASLAPEGGAFSWTQEGSRVTAVEGEVDWEAGTAWTRASYLEGFPTVESSQELSFSLGVNGAWTGSRTMSVTDRAGGSDLRTHEVRKEGCTTWETHVDEETARTTEIEATLVAADRREWTSTAGDEAGLTEAFELSSVDTSDWTSVQTYLADDPGDGVDPNRSGECTHRGDGTSTCVGRIHYEGGGTEWGTVEQDLYGDSIKTWERDRTGDGEIESWGTTAWAWEGDGWSTWIVLRDGDEVSCSGSWGTDGSGTWTCDDGSSGSYPH